MSKSLIIAISIILLWYTLVRKSDTKSNKNISKSSNTNTESVMWNGIKLYTN